MKRFKQELMFRAGSFLAWVIVQLIGHTTRFHVHGTDRIREHEASGKGLIFALWHGRTLLPVYYHRGMGIWAITSLSRDGEFQTRIIGRFGFRAIRGSTGRGGIKAALTACKRLAEGGILAITPDGPKGPIYEIQDGTIFMARHAGCPIVPVGVGYSRRKVTNAWDKYAFPLPFGTCEMLFGDAIPPPKDDSEAESLAVRDALSTALLHLQKQAELAAGEGV